jgi:hypothetical protein
LYYRLTEKEQFFMQAQDYSFLLFLLAKIRPEMWDFASATGSVLSKGTQDVLAGQIIKSVSDSVCDQELKKELYEIGRSLYTSGKVAMSYDEDNFCSTHYLYPVLPAYNDGSSLPHTQSLPGAPDAFEYGYTQPLPAKRLGILLYMVAGSIAERSTAHRLTKTAAILMKEHN